jgi:Rrf2 family transcriptional regulator, nitric oxide-sensitive transcriptional repressor
MRLTHYSDCALRMLMYLGADPARQATTAEIARACGIAEDHLTKIVHQLGRAGYVETTRGRKGGLRLGKPPGDINLGAVLRSTEPDFALVPCFAGTACIIAPGCALGSALAEALGAFLAVLDRYTLADLVAGSRPSAEWRESENGLTVASDATH